MGRLVCKTPNHDPERLGRVLDAKRRTIGVGAICVPVCCLRSPGERLPRRSAPRPLCFYLIDRSQLAGPSKQVDKEALERQVREKEAAAARQREAAE